MVITPFRAGIAVLILYGTFALSFWFGRHLEQRKVADFDKTACDVLIDSALTDICAQCMCGEYSRWWCRSP